MINLQVDKKKQWDARGSFSPTVWAKLAAFVIQLWMSLLSAPSITVLPFPPHLFPSPKGITLLHCLSLLSSLCLFTQNHVCHLRWGPLQILCIANAAVQSWSNLGALSSCLPNLLANNASDSSAFSTSILDILMTKQQSVGSLTHL